MRRIAPRHKASTKACPEQATARRMGGRERLRPNRGFPVTSRATGEPPQRNRSRAWISQASKSNVRPQEQTAMSEGSEKKCKMQRPEDPGGAHLRIPNLSMNRSFRSARQVLHVGSCVFQGRPGSPGSDGASPYHTNSHHFVYNRVPNKHSSFSVIVHPCLAVEQ
jgi:hypothetical protein